MKQKREFEKTFLIRRFNKKGFYFEPISFDDVWSWHVKELNKALKQARQEERTRILGIVEGMNVVVKKAHLGPNRDKYFFKSGYKQALTDIKKEI